MFVCLDVTKYPQTNDLLTKIEEMFKEKDTILVHNGDKVLTYLIAPQVGGQALKQAIITKLSQG